MADSQRLRTVPEGIRLVSEIAGELARRQEHGRTSVLAVTTYLPMDVDSVARVFEGLEEIAGVERVQEGERTVYELDGVERFAPRGAGIDEPAFLEEARMFLRAVGSLKQDQEWVRKVREQHELLRIAAEAKKPELELSYITSRTEMPRARVQSLLNDFGAEGYVEAQVDEEADQIFYTFPELEYGKERFERNMALLEEVPPPAGTRVSLWVISAVFAVILLAIIILTRF